MPNTPNLALPFIDQNQSQKHVTHNAAIRELDAIVQLGVLDDSLTAPPTSPTDGDRHIIAASPTGAWTGHAGNVAAWQDGAWQFYAPKSGWLAFVASRSEAFLWTGAAWVPLASVIGALANLAGLGILTAADATNRLAVKSDAALFTHDDVTPGSGDMRVAVNKSAAAKDAGFTFQDGYSTRAIFGLLANDNLTFKVSADGSIFHDALAIDKATGNLGVGGVGVAKAHVLVDSGSFSWGNVWDGKVLVVGDGLANTSGGFAVSYDATRGAIIGSLIPTIAWKPLTLKSNTLDVYGGGEIPALTIDATGKGAFKQNSLTAATEAHGGTLKLGVLEATVTLSGATTDAAVQIPANCIVVGVSNRVTTAITGATSYDCGDVGGSASRFGGSLGVSAGSTNFGLIGPNPYYAATTVRFTANGGGFTGGVVRMTIHYLSYDIATS